MTDGPHPFLSGPGLPARMATALIERGGLLAGQVAARMSAFADSRHEARAALEANIAQVDDEVLDSVPAPTVSATDGALVCDSRSFGDLCAAVAVTVGPDSPGDDSCEVRMESARRSPANRDVLAGAMAVLEISMTADSTAGAAMADGTLLSALIAVSTAVRARRGVDPALASLLDPATEADFRDRVMHLLRSRSHMWVPKYVTSNEFRHLLPERLREHDGRTVASMVLRPGEMTFWARRNVEAEGVTAGDRKIEANRSLMARSLGFGDVEALSFSEALDGFSSCYYRPHPWTQAFRIDVTGALAADPEAQVTALRAVRDATTAAGLREPFPLHLADLFAKQVSAGVAPVVDMAATAAIDDPDASMLVASSYRS